MVLVNDPVKYKGAVLEIKRDSPFFAHENTKERCKDLNAYLK